jgi:hypothetical protein
VIGDHAVNLLEFTMKIHAPHKPHRSHTDDADEPEPGLLPVEPDQGPVPDGIPGDPEHDRTVDPEA